MSWADRLTISILVVSCFLLPGRLLAQGDPLRGGYGGYQQVWDQSAGYVQMSSAPQSAGYAQQTTWLDAVADGQQQGWIQAAPVPPPQQMPSPMTRSTGYWQERMPPGTAYACPNASSCSLPYGPTATPVPGYGYYGPDGIITTQRDSATEWPEHTPFERFIVRMVKPSWVRLEYLIWKIKEPGNVLLGSETEFADDPRLRFPVFNFDNPPTQIGFARVPSLAGISFRDTDGIRGTWGIPLLFGELEISAFLMEQASDVVVFGEQPFGEFIGTTTLEDGQISNLILLYDDAFTARYTSDIWGTELNVVFDQSPPGEGIKLKQLVGLRFLNIQEQLRQVGVFSAGTPNVLTSVIDSDSSNNLYGATLGVRTEFVHRWFTVGVEPKITLGLDSFRNRVTTENLRSLADGKVVTEEHRTIFSPVAEFGAYARIHVCHNFSLHVAYNLLWAARITRPHDNIFYNDSLNGPPGIVLDTEIHHIQLHGLNIGGDLRF